MDGQKSFIVLQNKRSCQNDIELNEYVCVPRSWIRLNVTHNNVVVGYPSNDELFTILRDIEHQPLSNKWPLLNGEIIFESDSKDEAFGFLQGKNGNYVHEIQHDQLTGNARNLDNKETKKTMTINKVTNKSISNNVNHSEKGKHSEQEQIPSLQVDKKRQDETNTCVISDSIRSYIGRANGHNLQIAGPSTSSALNYNKTPESETTKIPLNESENTKIKISENEDTSSFKILDMQSDKEDPAVVSSTPIALTKSVTSGISTTTTALHDVRISNHRLYTQCLNFYKTFNASCLETMSAVDNTSNCIRQIISTYSNVIDSPFVKNQQPNTIEAPTTTPLSEPRLLPREQMNDSTKCTKWTLRYPHPGPGIKELMKNSGVYVSKHGLRQCQINFVSVNKFARALLDEIFTDKAVKECSWTGAPAGRCNRENRQRPGLDLKARETLIDYVLVYCKKMGLKSIDAETIIKSLRNKLCGC